MFQPYRSTISLVLLGAWLLFVGYIWLDYWQVSRLQQVTVGQLASQPPEHGWYRVTGGIMDYPATVGWAEYGKHNAYFRSYVPLLDPGTKKPVLLVGYYGQGASPAAVGSGGFSQTPTTVQGTVVYGSKTPRAADLLGKEGVTVSGAIPVLIAGGGPSAQQAGIMTLISALLIGVWIARLYRFGSA